MDAVVESGNNPVGKHQPIRFRPSVENEPADVGRVQGKVHFPCSADHEQDWQPTIR